MKSSIRNSGVDGTVTQPVTLEELDYVRVFDLIANW